EVFLDAADGDREKLRGLKDTQIRALAGRSAEVIGWSAVLRKYQTALDSCGVKEFDTKTEPYQSAEHVVKLRNALIHYHPEWDDEQGTHEDIEKRLKGRFPLNRLTGSGHLWFPHQCLGSGCAKWAVERATEFMETFCRMLNIPNRVP